MRSRFAGPRSSSFLAWKRAKERCSVLFESTHYLRTSPFSLVPLLCTPARGFCSFSSVRHLYVVLVGCSSSVLFLLRRHRCFSLLLLLVRLSFALSTFPVSLIFPSTFLVSVDCSPSLLHRSPGLQRSDVFFASAYLEAAPETVAGSPVQSGPVKKSATRLLAPPGAYRRIGRDRRMFLRRFSCDKLLRRDRQVFVECWIKVSLHFVFRFNWFATVADYCGS